MSDFQDKSMESRNMKNKFNVNSFLSYKSLSKEKSPKIENKDNRGGQNSSIFMNIMLKKLASQKSQSKKTL